jgi:hypothetical protein
MRIMRLDTSNAERKTRAGCTARFHAIAPGVLQSRRFPVPARILWTNAVTLGSVAVLVGTELVGAGGAAGWALGGLFQLGDVLTHMLEGLLILFALTGLYFFLRAALAHEPIRG